MQTTIRRATRRLVRLYINAAKANAAHSQIPLATGPFSALDEVRRTRGNHQMLARDHSGTRHG
ncbi:hypothetical protein T261_7070 [Streptomyces lydicus]|nr:hypothetical protein T261_7070 [Streptomyces lydicus]